MINWFDFNPLQSYNDPYLEKSKNQLRNKRVKLQNFFLEQQCYNLQYYNKLSILILNR